MTYVQLIKTVKRSKIKGDILYSNTKQMKKQMKKQMTTDQLARKVSRGDFTPKQDNKLFDKLAPKDEKGFTQLSMPIIIRPSQMPGKVITGKVIGLIDSPVKGFKNKLLMMENNGTSFAFPVTETIGRALRAHVGGELTSKNVDGMQLMIRGLGKTQTSDGKRSVNLFEVYVK